MAFAPPPSHDKSISFPWMQWLHELWRSPEYIYAVWGGENGALADATFEYSFGNGGVSSQSGVVIYVPAGWQSHIVAMGAANSNIGGTSVIAAAINGVGQGAACDVTISGYSGINSDFTPVELENGDRLNFVTTTAGTNSAPTVVTAWIKVTKA